MTIATGSADIRAKESYNRANPIPFSNAPPFTLAYFNEKQQFSDETRCGGILRVLLPSPS